MSNREKEVQDILPLIKACGLYDKALKERLLGFPESRTDLYEVIVNKKINGQAVIVKLDIRSSKDGGLAFGGYDLLLKRQQKEFEHFLTNGVDTKALENRMAGINWREHPDHFITAEEAVKDPGLKKMQEVFHELEKFTANYLQRNEEY